MKKLMSVLVMVIFMAGMVVAQNNQSEVAQTGDDNEATIEQLGQNNVSDLRQERRSGWPVVTSALDGNLYELHQEGSGNVSKLGQNWGSSEAYVNQVGDNNQLTSSSTFSNSNNYYGESGFAIQGGSVLELDQIGDENVAGINQRAKDNYADIDQVGNKNEVDVFQYSFGGVAPPAFGNDAFVQQTGDENSTVITQSGDMGSSGRSNTASVAIDGDQNTTRVDQYGNQNSASMSVGHPNYAPSNYMNDVKMSQTGDNNTAAFGLQMGNNNMVDIDQAGDNNWSEFSIKYGSENEANIDVDGNGNRSRISISTHWGYMSSRNTIDLVQDGDGNYASGDVEGDRNTITVTQMGLNNRVGTSWYTKDGFDVYGENNTITIDQMSDGNMSLNKVTGWNNTINVSQQ